MVHLLDNNLIAYFLKNFLLNDVDEVWIMISKFPCHILTNALKFEELYLLS